MARISRWFLDITLDSSTLRWWSGTGSVSFGGYTYTGLADRWSPPESLKRKSSLKSEKIELEFDSSRQSDNSDPIGGLLDEKWRNRAVRLRRLAWDPGDGPDDGDVLEDERGRVRNLSDSLEAGSPATISMEIESGALAYLERRMETRSPAGQTRVFPGDKGFDLIAKLEGKTLAWRTKYKKAGTVQYELQEEYEPAPREWVLGRFAKTGSFVAAFTNQQQKKSLMRVYAIADHRINKLDKLWVNGDLVRNTALTHGTRTLLRIPGDKNENRAWITFYDGRPDQTADSFLQSVETTWTSAHRLRGVAYAIIEHRWDSDMANAYDYRFGGEGARLYDRRKDSTAGGSGSQRWNNPETWVYSANAMVAADHYRSGVRIMSGSDFMWFGVGEPLDAVPYSEFASLANHCDENITLKSGGTQKRYEVNGVLSAADDHAKNLEKIARQMAARPIDQGGRIAFRPPIERTPVITLTDGDLKRGTESVADPGGLIDDMVNTLSGRFINPANDYKKDDYPEVAVSAYVDDDNGEISDTLDLDLEISGERSQRIAKLKIEDSRRIFQLTETYTVKARVIEPGEWFVRESVIRGFPGGKTFVADEVTRFVDGSIEVVATEIDPDQLVWDKETAVDLSVPPAFPQLSLPDIDPPTIAVSAVELGSDGNLTPGVQLNVTLPADLDDVIADRTEMEYGFSDGASSPDIDGESFVLDFDPRRSTLVYSGFQPSRAYVFRFRGVENRGDDGKRYGQWSAFQEVTTTANATATSSSSAAAVPWSGVSGAGKPDDNADVTSDNTAAGIEGQGALATANEAQWASQVTGVGKPQDDATKSRVFRQASAPSSPNTNDIWVVLVGGTPIAVRAWDGSSWVTGADLTSLNTAAGFAGQNWGATASEADAANNVVRGEIAPANLLPAQYAMPHQNARPMLYTPNGAVRTGDNSRAHQSLSGQKAIPVESDETQPYFFIRLTSGSGGTNLVLPDGRFAYKILVNTFSSVTSITVRLRDGSNVARYSNTFTRNASQQLLEGYFDVSAASAGTNEFYLDLSFNLSGTVYSQAWYHYAYIAQIPETQSALGPLPAIDHKLVGIEDNADVTENNDAAGFVGQGSLATGNMYYQDSDPASAADGDFWGDSSANELKYRSGGVWNKIADIGGGGTIPKLTVTPSSLNYTQGTGIKTQALTIAPSGFNSTGSPNYVAELLFDDGSIVSLDDPTTATPDIITNTNAGPTTAAVRVTYFLNGESAQDIVTISCI